MNILKKAFGNKAEETAQDVARELAGAEASAARAADALKAAKETYSASLLAVDANETIAARETVSRREIELDRSIALVGALQAGFASAVEREAESERRRVYDEAKTAADEARRRLQQYPGHAAEIASIIIAVAHAELAIRKANAELPAGAEKIPGVEASVRSVAACPAKVISERTEDSGWYYCDGPFAGDRVEEHFQSECKPRHAGARLGVHERKFATVGRKVCAVVRRRQLVRTMSKHVPAEVPEGLSFSVNLPGLRHGEPPLWQPAGGASFITGHDPAANAREALARAAALEAARRSPRREQREGSRGTEQTTELLDEPELLDEARKFAAELAGRSS